jgi:hypothetical protein
MLNGDLKSKIDQIWNAFWFGLNDGNNGKFVNKALLKSINLAKVSDDQLKLLERATGYRTSCTLQIDFESV